MRSSFNTVPFAPPRRSRDAAPQSYRLSFDNELGDDPGEPASPGRTTSLSADLSFSVELWNEPRTSVERVLALTASGSIGYAAFYAATRDYADRLIVLRHRNRILSRWNASGH